MHKLALQKYGHVTIFLECVNNLNPGTGSVGIRSFSMRVEG